MSTKQAKELNHNDPEFLPVQFNLTTQRLNQLAEDFNAEDIPQASTKGDEGYLVIHEKVMAITRVRTSLEAKRKELKSDAVAWGKKVDGEAGRLRGIIEGLEKPWRDVKLNLDEAEKRAAEEARIATEKREAEVQANISKIKSMAEGLLTADSTAIETRLMQLQAMEVTEADFGEYLEAANYHKDSICATLTSALAQRREMEASEAALKEQQRELAEGQAKLKQQQDQLEKEQREAKEIAEREEKEKLAAKEAAEREEREEKEAADKLKREREEAATREAELKARMPDDRKLREYMNKVSDCLQENAPKIKDAHLKSEMIIFQENVEILINRVLLQTQEEKK